MLPGRHHPRTAVALALSAMLLAACRLGPGETGDREAPDVGAPALAFPPEGRQGLRGYLVFGNELHAFQSCGLPALTWIDLQGGEKGWDKLQAVQEACGPDAGASCDSRFTYVELDAIVSGPCRCGHLGKYERELHIEELLAASATAPADCPRTPPHFP